MTTPWIVLIFWADLGLLFFGTVNPVPGYKTVLAYLISGPLIWACMAIYWSGVWIDNYIIVWFEERKD